MTLDSHTGSIAVREFQKLEAVLPPALIAIRHVVTAARKIVAVGEQISDGTYASQSSFQELTLMLHDIKRFMASHHELCVAFTECCIYTNQAERTWYEMLPVELAKVAATSVVETFLNKYQGILEAVSKWNFEATPFVNETEQKRRGSGACDCFRGSHSDFPDSQIRYGPHERQRQLDEPGSAGLSLRGS